MSLWVELSRRGVVRVALAYLAFAWLIVQVASTVLPAFGAPDWALRAVIVAFVIGFPLAVILSWRYELTAGGIELDSGAAATPTASHGRRLDFLIIGLLVLALSAMFAERYLSNDFVPDIQSIAVLPLENLSGDADRDYFVDGMTDALTTSLARIGALRVVSRTSVMQFKDSELTLPEIAMRLGVRTVLAGTASYVGGRVRITAQLIDAATDRHLWADTYDQAVEDVLRLQNDVALDIAREVSIAITPDERTRLLTTRRINPETYEAYLRGMYYLNGSTAQDFANGLEYLQQAVDADPGDALAYAGLALGYGTIAHSLAPPEGVWQRSRSAAQRAINLDPDLAEAYLALGNAKLYFEWDFDGARDALERAIDLNPSLAMARYHYAWYLALIGRIDDAIVEHALARDLDPLTPLHSAWLGSLYSYQGRFDEAIATAEQALEINPRMPEAHFVRAAALLGLGETERAMAAFEALVEISTDWRGMLAMAHAITGNEAEARRIMTDLEAQYAEAPLSWLSRDIAMIHTLLGETAEGARWLAEAPYHAFVPWFAVDAMVEPRLREEPRYQEFMAELDLPDGSCCLPYGLLAQAAPSSP